MTLEQEKSARGILFVVLFANIFLSIGSSIITIGLPSYILQLSGTLISYGVVLGIYSVTNSLFQFPMAALSDNFGRKKVILLGILVYALGSFLCYLAQDIVQLIIFRLIQGIGAYGSIVQSIVGDAYKKEEHGKGMAYYSISFTVGYFAGISIGGYISYYLGYRIIFLICVFLALIVGLLFLIFFRDFRNNNLNNYNNNNTTKEKKSMSLSNAKVLLKDSQYRIAVIINCLRLMILMSIISYLIWVLEIHFGLNQIQTSYILVILIGIYIFFVLFTGKLVDRFGTKKILLIGQIIIVICGIFYFIVNLTNDLLSFLLLNLISGLGFGMYETSGNTLLLKKIIEVNPNLKGGGFGINNMFGYFLSAMGPIILSLLGEISIFLPYYFITILIFIAFLIVVKFVKN